MKARSIGAHKLHIFLKLIQETIFCSSILARMEERSIGFLIRWSYV
eukprot:COSAG06_NODE_57806_length_279_cov_0.577778_1_plen_45_part_01